MKGVVAIARRDLASTFLVPTGWIVLAAWGLVATLVFMLLSFAEGQPATLRAVVSVAGWALLIVAPAISMRSFAEESRLGTLEVLLTSPLSALELVIGKLVAAMLVLVIMAVPILVLAVVTEIYGDPDPGELACGMFGLLLYGSSLVSIGILVSTRTSSQVVAYLVTFFSWFLLVLVAKGLPSLLPEIMPFGFLSADRLVAWVDGLRSLDPMVRLDDFAIGLIDTSNIAFFLGFVVFFTIMASISLASPLRSRTTEGGGASRSAATTLGIVGSAGACVAACLAISSPPLRYQADLTKTRAYSLRPATIDLLESLEPGWTVRMFVAGDDADPVTMRMVDEVVQRMDSVTTSLSVERIDPVDPRSVGRYEAVLEEYVARDQVTIDEWEIRIQEGLDAFEALRSLARELGPRTADLLPGLPNGMPVRSSIERMVLVFGTIADEGGAFTEFIENSLRSTLQRPLPAWRLARASVAANNANQANEFERLVDVMRDWTIDPSLPSSLREWSAASLESVEMVTGRLRSTANMLDSLEKRAPLPIAVIAESVAEGDVAIVDGPMGSTVIPAWQLFPSETVRQSGDGVVVGFDRRFQGEETLASAIRGLRLGSMPRVVLVHPEERTMLRPIEDGLDYSGIAEALRRARYEVVEWIPGRTDRPSREIDRVTVWMIMPALQRRGIEYSDPEKALIEAAAGLVEDGRPVLLTVARSLMPMVGQVDPWAGITAGSGLRAETGRVVFEWATDLVDEVTGSSRVRVWQEIDGPPDDESIDGPAASVAEALRGKRFFVTHANPISINEAVRERVTVLAAVEPRPLRWIESDWRGDGARIEGPPTEDGSETASMLDAAVPVAVAVDGSGDDGTGRLVLVGSGGWALSAFVNDAGNLGDQRMVLANPGNRELALSAVAWLAGLDELVATGASGREISRFEGVGTATRNAFGVVLALLLGAGPLLVGAGVTSWRRTGR